VTGASYVILGGVISGREEVVVVGCLDVEGMLGGDSCNLNFELLFQQ